MTCKSSSPIGRMEMEKGAIGFHRSDGEGSTSTSDTQAIGSHRSDGDGERRHSSGPIGRMEKGPTGTHRMEKGSSGDFYDELQASRMSNYGPIGTCQMEKVPCGDL